MEELWTADAHNRRCSHVPGVSNYTPFLTRCEASWMTAELCKISALTRFTQLGTVIDFAEGDEKNPEAQFSSYATATGINTEPTRRSPTR